MNWLNYHHLYYFYTIAQIGSMTKAAEELKVGQSALSLQLKQFEAIAGELFDRRGQRLVLNERGKIVYQYAKEIFSRGDELKKVLNGGELAIIKEVNIGVEEGVPKAITALFLKRFLKKYDAHYKLKELSFNSMEQELSSGRVDMILHLKEQSGISGFMTKYLFKEKVSVWASPDFIKLADGFPQSLNNHPFIVPPVDHPLRIKLENFFKNRKLTLNAKFEVPDTALVKEMGTKGIGLIALGESTTKEWFRAGKLCLIGKLDYEQEYFLSFKKKGFESQLAKAMENL